MMRNQESEFEEQGTLAQITYFILGKIIHVEKYSFHVTIQTFIACHHMDLQIVCLTFVYLQDFSSYIFP
jgi:hypothetical protein